MSKIDWLVLISIFVIGCIASGFLVHLDAQIGPWLLFYVSFNLLALSLVSWVDRYQLAKFKEENPYWYSIHTTPDDNDPVYKWQRENMEKAKAWLLPPLSTSADYEDKQGAFIGADKCYRIASSDVNDPRTWELPTEYLQTPPVELTDEEIKEMKREGGIYYFKK